MRIPGPVFVLVNAVVRTLLKSPIHGLMSDNILLINYSGRKSGRKYSTPVRYARNENRIRCFTSSHVQWWRNLTVNAEVTLLIGGKTGSYRARVLERDPEKTQQLLVEFLALFPQDAVYQDIRLNSDGSLNSDDLIEASHKAIVVEFEEA